MIHLDRFCGSHGDGKRTNHACFPGEIGRCVAARFADAEYLDIGGGRSDVHTRETSLEYGESLNNSGGCDDHVLRLETFLDQTHFVCKRAQVIKVTPHPDATGIKLRAPLFLSADYCKNTAGGTTDLHVWQ